MPVTNITIYPKSLIGAIEAHPIIWDKSIDNYDRNKSRRAWDEICLKLNADYEKYDEKSKEQFGKTIFFVM